MKKEYEFKKKLITSELMHGDLQFYIKMFASLIVCMKESNKENKKFCELFCMRYRESFPGETGPGGLVIDFEWGERNE